MTLFHKVPVHQPTPRPFFLLPPQKKQTPASGDQRKSLEAYLEIFGADVNDFSPSARIIIDILLKRLEHRGG